MNIVKNRKLIRILLLLIVIGIVIFIIKLNSDTNLKKDAIFLTPGATYKIDLSKYNDDIIDYIIDSEDIVKINDNSEIEALSVGSTNVALINNIGKKIGQLKIIVELDDKIDSCIEIERISILNEEESVIIGKSKEISLLIEPINATDEKITWMTSNNEIAKIDELGIVTGVKEGTAIIKAISSNNKEASIKINVIKEEIKVTSISLYAAKNQISIDEKLKISYILKPEKVTESIAKWNSSNMNVATIDENGIVTGRGIGTTIITAETNSGIKETMQIEVIKKENPETPSQGGKILPSSIQFNKTAINMYVGDEEKLSYTIKPSNVTENQVVITTSNSSIVTIDELLIKAISPGNATITAKTSNGKTTICKVTVNALNIDATSFEVDKNFILLSVNESLKININNIKPSNTTKTAEYSVIDFQKATVSSNGTITGKNIGTTKIKIKLGSIEKQIPIQVLPTGDKIFFLNTGASDAIILKSGENFAMIDTGTYSNVNTVKRYLNNLNIKTLQFVLITHFHSDHYGGLTTILNNYNVQKLYMKEYLGFDSVTDNGANATDAEINQLRNTQRNKFLEYKNSTRTTFYEISSVQNTTLGNFKFDFFNTSDRLSTGTGTNYDMCIKSKNCNENANSIAVYGTTYGKKLYFSGDIQNQTIYKSTNYTQDNIYMIKEIENDIAKFVNEKRLSNGTYKIDLYKSSHHGFVNNNTGTAIGYLNPVNAIVTNTVSNYNRYISNDYPRDDTPNRVSYLRNLSNVVAGNGGKILITGNGTIVANISPSGVISLFQLSNEF